MFKLPDNPHKEYAIVGEKYGWVEGNRAHLEFNSWQEGGEAYLKAVVNWLFNPCTEHDLYEDCHHACILEGIKADHRYLCPQCMQQLKEWSEEL